MNQLLSQDSKNLISFLEKLNIKEYNNSPHTNYLLLLIYDAIMVSNKNIYKIKIKKSEINYINSEDDIPKCSLYNNIIPEIRENILNLNYSITYSCEIENLKLKINLIFENMKEQYIFDKYIYLIILWIKSLLYLTQSESNCENLEIFLYLTDLKKNLPIKGNLISRFYANTGFTVPCKKNEKNENNLSSIIIYRKEEWFKVFIHETIHFFNLDFADLNEQSTTDFILKIFPIKSEVKLYEAYTEFWAKIINACILNFIQLKIIGEENNLELFLKNIQKSINYERFYILFQAVKMLDHMNISYFDFIYQEKYETNLENYQEQSALFSYFVINSILFHFYEDFIFWCNKNNENLIGFNNTDSSKYQIKLCQFIFSKYRKESFLNRVQDIENIFHNLNKNNYKNNTQKFIFKNIRQSIYEIK